MFHFHSHLQNLCNSMQSIPSESDVITDYLSELPSVYILLLLNEFCGQLIIVCFQTNGCQFRLLQCSFSLLSYVDKTFFFCNRRSNNNEDSVRIINRLTHLSNTKTTDSTTSHFEKCPSSQPLVKTCWKGR